MNQTGIEEVELHASGMTFRALAGGPIDGEPVLLLHGIPETSAMWREVIDALAQDGYRCVAPDQRGYSPGARPAEVADYDRFQLVDDVFNLASAAGFDRFHIVAHDWGAAVAWCAAGGDVRRRIASLTALSIPHYRAFAEATRDDPAAEGYRDQLAMLTAPDDSFVQMLLADDAAGLRAHLDVHSDELIDEYMSVLGDPAAFNAAVNWYRASEGHMKILDDVTIPIGQVTLPTMVIWGNRDVAVTRMAVERGREYVAGPHEFVELDAGHWLVQEKPDVVIGCIRRQLRRYPLVDSSHVAPTRADQATEPIG